MKSGDTFDIQNLKVVVALGGPRALVESFQQSIFASPIQWPFFSPAGTGGGEGRGEDNREEAMALRRSVFQGPILSGCKPGGLCAKEPHPL
jgi:hypothetical protein